MALAVNLRAGLTNFFAAVLYFPIPAYVLLGFAGLPPGFTSAAALGWFVYISLTIAALRTRKRFTYYTLCSLLCLLLLLNVLALLGPAFAQ